MFDISWLMPRNTGLSKEALIEENENLKKQIQELLNLDETGFFIELNSLLKSILKKTLILCKAEASFFALIGKTEQELDIRICNLILEEKMEKIREGFRNQFQHWQESEAELLTVGDFILLPLVRRHKMLGVIGLKLNSDAPENVCEILPILASQAAASLESAILYERMFKRLLVLSNVFILGKEIVTNIDIGTLVDKFLSIARDGTDSAIACIYLLRDKIAKPYFTQAQSDKGLITFAPNTNSGYTDLIKIVREEEKPRLINDFKENSFAASEQNKLIDNRIEDTTILPLQLRDSVLGVIQVANKKGNASYRPEDLDLLKILGSQIAFVIQNSDLFRNLQRAYIDTLYALTSSIEAKDSYTKGHSERVTELSVKLAEAMKLSTEKIEQLKIAGVLHDIGKIGIPEGILNKPGRLTNEEFTIIKSHPELGTRILEKVEFLSDMIPIIKHHHERYDGKGYPDGLEGENIPFLSRIISLADTFDAMTTDRPYRKALSIDEAIAEIVKYSGTQFDPTLAPLFIEMIQSES